VEKIRHPGAREASCCSGYLGGGISFFRHEEPQAQGDPDDDVFSGLRASETARLKLTDIDSKRMTVKVNDGKGARIATPFCPKRPLSFYGNTGEISDPRSGCLRTKEG